MKHWLTGALPFVIAIGFAVLLWQLPHEPAIPPSLTTFLSKTSPDGLYEATFYKFYPGGDGYLGATVPTPKCVNIRRRTETFNPREGVVLATSAERLRLVWTAKKQLQIDYESGQRIYSHQEHIGEISIVVRPIYPSTSEALHELPAP
ncbi:hypothetical protein [Armatimonas sp.]|uniref:hypothetical protein n=1 Tax=Armatimonas sp. TaxID=1872638 RepID=UPI00286BFEE9|nr:hypothetical protein [Armatimonas sp.]